MRHIPVRDSIENDVRAEPRVDSNLTYFTV